MSGPKAIGDPSSLSKGADTAASSQAPTCAAVTPRPVERRKDAPGRAFLRRAGVAWTDGEILSVLRWRDEGASQREMAARLGRTRDSVMTKLRDVDREYAWSL